MKILDDPIEVFLPNSKVFSHFDYFGQTVTQGPQGSILVRVQGVRTMGYNPYWSHIIIFIPLHLKKVWFAISLLFVVLLPKSIGTKGKF